MYKISEYVKMAYENSISKGWYDSPKSGLESLMLMISEISEATEEVRANKPDFYELNGKQEGQSVELADLCLRIFDYAGYKNVNLCEYLNKQFFIDLKDIEYIHDIKEYIKKINDFRAYDEIENIETDIEFHATISISIAEAAKSLINKDGKEFKYLANAIIKTIYFSEVKRWDIDNIIHNKHVYNLNRPYKHGGKKC